MEELEQFDEFWSKALQAVLEPSWDFSLDGPLQPASCCQTGAFWKLWCCLETSSFSGDDCSVTGIKHIFAKRRPDGFSEVVSMETCNMSPAWQRWWGGGRLHHTEFNWWWNQTETRTSSPGTLSFITAARRRGTLMVHLGSWRRRRPGAGTDQVLSIRSRRPHSLLTSGDKFINFPLPLMNGPMGGLDPHSSVVIHQRRHRDGGRRDSDSWTCFCFSGNRKFIPSVPRLTLYLNFLWRNTWTSAFERKKNTWLWWETRKYL